MCYLCPTYAEKRMLIGCQRHEAIIMSPYSSPPWRASLTYKSIIKASVALLMKRIAIKLLYKWPCPRQLGRQNLIRRHILYVSSFGLLGFLTLQFSFLYIETTIKINLVRRRICILCCPWSKFADEIYNFVKIIIK